MVNYKVVCQSIDTFLERRNEGRSLSGEVEPSVGRSQQMSGGLQTCSRRWCRWRCTRRSRLAPRAAARPPPPRWPRCATPRSCSTPCWPASACPPAWSRPPTAARCPTASAPRYAGDRALAVCPVVRSGTSLTTGSCVTGRGGARGGRAGGAAAADGGAAGAAAAQPRHPGRGRAPAARGGGRRRRAAPPVRRALDAHALRQAHRGLPRQRRQVPPDHRQRRARRQHRAAEVPAAPGGESRARAGAAGSRPAGHSPRALCRRTSSC